MLRSGVVAQLLFFLSAPLLGLISAAFVHATEEAAPPIDLVAEAVQLTGYLLILVVLAALAVHLGRRFRPGLGGDGPIHVIDGRNLAPGVGVRLIRVGSQSWLVGVTKEHVSLLAEVATDNPASVLSPVKDQSNPNDGTDGSG